MKLIPMPKFIQEYEGIFTHKTVKIVTSVSDVRIAKAIQTLPISENGALLEIEMGTNSSEAYTIELTENKISLRADGHAGVFYGIQTLRQIFENDEIPCLYIEDKPDFSYRGFYHDVTRGRVPAVETIKHLIDEMAYYKMNSLQLYVEHTFAFAEMADITERTGYLTAEDIKELDDYCYENFIEFVPSIATFGHLYELLQKPEYKELCVLEDYEPSYHFWVERMRHHTIDPVNPKSFELVKSLIDQYMPLFRTDKFNICCDETFDLSEGRHKDGNTEKLYVDFVLQLISYLKSKGKTVMMWADILLKHPDAIPKLPDDIQFLNWHYGKEVNEDAIAVFERLAKNQIVCPGTQSWATFCPWIEHAEINISRVAQLGRQYNALGILNTNWGDYGHPCTLGMCMYPMVFGAARSWNADTQIDDNWEQSVDRLLFGQPQALALLRKLDSLQLTEAWSTLTCWYSNHISRENLPVPIPPEAEILHCIQGCKDISEMLKGQKWEKDGYREEMLIAAEGMQVIAQIFAAIAGYAVPQEISVLQWLETYKQQWRKESKESELHVIENLFLFAEKMQFIRRRRVIMSLKYVLIGAGMRGQAYSEAAFKEHGCQIVAVADPNKNVRDYIRDTYNVPEDMCFERYEQVFRLGKIADFAMVCTQDKMHLEPSLMAIEQGYDLLLEKPAAPTPEECMQICKAAEEKGVRVLICHVLRYTQFFRTVKDIVDSGRIGKIMSVIHTEGVGDVHYSHSYVRGNWHNSKESSNMLLAKSCHDLDILQWLIGANCKKIQSFGRLSHFCKENCPKGAPKRCMEGCPHGETCAYHTKKIYLPEKLDIWSRLLRYHVVGKVDPTDEEVEQALQNTNYGVCVFQSDNDVVDHQTVNMEFENGETVVFTMAAFNFSTRRIRIMGTKGELSSEDLDTITLNTFCVDDVNSEFYGKPRTEIFKCSEIDVAQDITGGHGGGDNGIVDDLCLYFGENIKTKSISDIRTSIMNHMLVFAAEESRATNTVVDVEEFVKRYL